MKTFILAILSVAAASAAMSIKLETSVSSPQPVGSVIGILPRVEISSPSMYTYRYSVSTAGGPFRIVRDFSQAADFSWTPDLYEHEARVRVTFRNNATRETAESEIPFRIVSRVKGTNPVITPTSHPLVALFSAPACPEGSEFRVAFRRQGEEVPMHTPAEPCRANISRNVLVAGMRADSDYQMRAEVLKSGAPKPGAWMPFHTGLVDGRFPPITNPTPRAAGQMPAEGIVIRSMMDPWRSAATDLDGNLLWYLNPASNSFVTRVLPGGRFLVHADGLNSGNDMKRWQLLREVDLLGNTVRETNIGVLAEELAKRGINSDCKKGGRQCVSGFHHEAIRLPNGHTLVLAGLERMFPAGTQGAKGEVDILGDLVLDLDENLQLGWFWNSFDHLDLKRASLGDE
jgi:arylsulfate sulfotransferase